MKFHNRLIDFVRCVWYRSSKSKKNACQSMGQRQAEIAHHIKKALSTSIREVERMSNSELVMNQAKSAIENSISEALERFQNDKFGTVRVVMRNNDPWFVAFFS